MVAPTSLPSVASPDLARDVPASAPAVAKRGGIARAAYVPWEGTLPAILEKALGPGVTGPRRSSRARSSAAWRPSSSAKGYAPSAKAKPSKSDPLSFLKDPRLSIEDKLMRLLGYLNQQWEKEMQAKLDQIGQGEAAKGAASKPAGTKKKGGLLGGLAGAVSSVLGPAGIALEALKVPAVRTMLAKIGGPVLAAGATALGFPQLAPLLLRHGPKLVEVAAGVASALDGKAGASGSGSSSSSTSGGAKAMSDSERQTLLMEIQRIQQKQQEMFGLVSNILKANHDTRSSIIGNIR